MDPIKEYHDPDYPEGPVQVKQEPPSLSEEEKVEKIKLIIHREFSNELEAREGEVLTIDQRMASSRRLLHRLRYSLVSRYYSDQKLQLTVANIQDDIAVQRDPRAKAEVSSQLRDGQRNIHPSVRKLLGKETVDIDEIFRTRGPRNKSRKDYIAMLQKRNYTISADATKSLRPELDEPTTSSSQLPKKVPRHLDPKPSNVVTLDEATRNQMKHRYRFIIGNTSKYVPAASRLDRSTHKWLLYIRGASHAPDPSPLLAGASVTLHHSYAPHHIVHLDKHPFHISRRGWGEFPAKIELQFTNPERNRPATVEHNIKLDRKYTGLQTLGSETIVDVWLYSTQEMLKYEYIEEDSIQTDKQTEPPPEIKQEIPDIPTDIQNDIQTDIQTDLEAGIEDIQADWMDFFKTPTEMDVDEMFIKPAKQTEIKQEIEIEPLPEIDEPDNILQVPTEILNKPVSIKKRIVKYIDPSTGKIYYLEMDRELDLTKVQEIIINNTATKISPVKSNGLKNVRKKKGVSLLKPEVKNQLKTENSIKIDRVKQNFPHLENDHCYISNPKVKEIEIKHEKSLYDTLILVMKRFTDVKAAVNYLVKKIPLISDEVRDPDFQKNFPFVVENSEKYWKLDYAKRRNIEWSRAKLINKFLSENFTGSIWRTKQILMYIRMHGYHPIRTEPAIKTENEYQQTIKEIYPHAKDISSLSIFKFDVDSSNDVLELSDDEDVDVLGCNVTVNVKKEVVIDAGLRPLEVEKEDRLRFLFIEKKCADIGIELRNEDVGNGYSYSAVHAVLLSAMRSVAEEVLRSALAEKRKESSPVTPPNVWTGTTSSCTPVGLHHVYRGLRSGRLAALSAKDTAAEQTQYYAI